MKYWFSADHHNMHDNIRKYCGRPFKDIKEQEECLLDNHNSLVKPGDIVYLLGDISMTKEGVESILSRMNGQKYFVLGNHDKKFINIIKKYCVIVKELLDTKINNQKITCCHYMMATWNCSHFGSFQLFGHTHGTIQPFGLQHDVGVDNNNFKPIEFEEIVEIMKDKKQHHTVDGFFIMEKYN
jgi:calcineurin-like phosphoesterase family protein